MCVSLASERTVVFLVFPMRSSPAAALQGRGERVREDTVGGGRERERGKGCVCVCAGEDGVGVWLKRRWGR